MFINYYSTRVCLCISSRCSKLNRYTIMDLLSTNLDVLSVLSGRIFGSPVNAGSTYYETAELSPGRINYRTLIGWLTVPVSHFMPQAEIARSREPYH